MSKIKYFLLGVICTLIVSGSGIYALGGFNFNKVGYPVYVDGEMINTDLYELDGRTYVPLRKLSEATGADINWIEASKVIYIKSKPAIEKIVTKEVIKEVPKEVVKEVTKEVIPKDSIFVTKKDNFYYFEKLDNNNTGFVFGIDFDSDRAVRVNKQNGNDVFKKFYVLEGNNIANNNVNSSQIQDNTAVYNIAYNNMKYTYDSSIQRAKDRYVELRNQAFARGEQSKQRAKEIFASSGIAGGINEDRLREIDLQVQNEINSYNTKEKEELNQIKIEFDYQVALLKIKYNIQ